MTSPSYLAVKKNDSSNWTVEQLCRKTIGRSHRRPGPGVQQARPW